IKRHQSGFTLIEIAIVLVIIGLLLGGILKGQELITQGRIRNVANDFQSMTAAINLYQDRYRAIPGDDIGAATRWAVAGTSTTSGNGNGVVAGTYNSTTIGDESRLFWHHLRLAGLVGGPTTTGALGTATPINAVSGVTGVQDSAFGIPGIVICSSNLPAKIAQAIDTQFDDGNATTGTVRGAAAMSATAPTVDYVDDGTTFYVVCKAP
ncbi:MAG: prepilin-type N-terminal cleavage/methylation domain-containing protein, partial [Thiobacillus sp.]|nr:prepilin-type N-terminal cleavage/methylation domain-containing protein [Thiobacillus sp.]